MDTTKKRAPKAISKRLTLVFALLLVASTLLAEGIGVSEVCDRCGFSDYSNFLKAFTKSVGISPKKYSQYCNK